MKKHTFSKFIIGNIVFLNIMLLCGQLWSQEVTIDEKKAILIYKFAENIEWDNENSIESFSIGVLSEDDKLFNNLKILETIKLRDKSIFLHKFYGVNDIKSTNILVVDESLNYVLNRVIESIEGKGTLLITDKCRNQSLVMINFKYSTDNNIEFEVNKANLIRERITIKPELLLLGGTEIDIAELYYESQRSMEFIKQKANDLEDELEKQFIEIESIKTEIKLRKAEIETHKARLKKQSKKIDTQSSVISDQGKELEVNREKLEEQQSLLEIKILELKVMEDSIYGSNLILDSLNKEILEKHSEIKFQKENLLDYEYRVKQQSTLIYIALSFLALVICLVIVIYRGFINKKRSAKLLEDKEAEIRMLFDVAPLPIVMSDFMTDQTIYINKQGIDLFKLNPATALDQKPEDYYVEPRQRNVLMQILKDKGFINNFEVRLKNENGAEFYGSLSGLIAKFEGNDIFFVAIKDITEIKNVVNELNEYKNHLETLVEERTHELIKSQGRFKDLAELLPETVLEIKYTGDISFINNNGLKSFGLETDDLIGGIEIFSLISDKDQNNAALWFKNLCSGRESIATEFFFKRKDNSLFPGIIYMNCSLEDNSGDIIRGIIIDITERKSMERRILKTIIETEEKERKRVAEDLHDGLGSLLSSLNLYVDMIDNKDLDNDERHNLFESLRLIIDEAVKNSKEISNNLRPSTLTRFGLVGSLKSFCDKINETGKVKINLNYEDFDHKLDKNVETALYRIVNELINNTVKYAEAENIDIVIMNTSKILTLTYIDNGKGFDTDAAFKSGGMGLKNILTRTDSLGGECEIISDKGKGLKVLINIELV